MRSVNEILLGREIELKKYCNKNGAIPFKNFHHLYSVHDLDKFHKEIRNGKITEIPMNILNEIKTQYKRRYDRLINTIKNEKIIYFIRYCIDNNDIMFEAVENFFKIIRSINNELECKFIIVTKDPNLVIKRELLLNKNFYVLNLRNYNRYDELANLKSLPVGDEVFKKHVKTMAPIYNYIKNIDDNLI